MGILMLLFAAISLAPFILIFYLQVKNFRSREQLNKLPGPPTLPILGNAHQVGKNPEDVLNQLFQWWNEAGRTNYRILIGPYHNIIITEAKDLEFIFTNKTLIDKSDVYDMLHPWLGTGLLTSTGKKWAQHRKMITPSFHFKILQIFHETMNRNTTKFMDKLRGAAHGDSIFDFQALSHYLTMDIIAETAMGVSVNAMDNPDAAVVHAFKDICSMINMRAYHPMKRNNFLYKFTPDYPKFCKALKILEDFTNEVIEKRIEKRKLEESQEDTEGGSTAQEEEEQQFMSKRKLAFLDTLLSATVDGRPLTQHEIYEEVSTFMFEGHDTSTSGICFAVYLLSIMPAIQQKVYEEQKKILADNINGEASYQEISDMQYLDMFIKEMLRLYPSVPLIGRSADKDYDMNGFRIPKGTSLNLLLMSLGYNEKYFPDPYLVNPERWGAEKRAQNPFEYTPFSAGQRNCVGQKFALLEIKTLVSKLVRTFEILAPSDDLIAHDCRTNHLIALPLAEQKRLSPDPPSKYKPILSAVLTLKSENGVWVRLRERM